ncbi:MAG: hypothetical protein K8R25_01365 [Methanosarcinales archaeon]|nr:hypothetical protein [Methanosarcinales archaeon]
MKFIEKLEKWVSEHPEAADAPTVNMNTGRETTIRGILEELKKEKETGIAIVDPEILEVKTNIEEWLEEVY